MSTSQGTYGRIEQTLHVIRDTYEICRAGVGGGVGGTVYSKMHHRLYKDVTSCLPDATLSLKRRTRECSFRAKALLAC